MDIPPPYSAVAGGTDEFMFEVARVAMRFHNTGATLGRELDCAVSQDAFGRSVSRPVWSIKNRLILHGDSMVRADNS